jgi:hypothetical protein
MVSLLNNMDKPTQHEVIIRYLQSQKGWVPSYLLSKRELNGVWVGSRGERSARDLVSPVTCPPKLEGKVERGTGKQLKDKGFTIDVFGEKFEDRYAYYRAIGN